MSKFVLTKRKKKGIINLETKLCRVWFLNIFGRKLNERRMWNFWNVFHEK